MTELQAAEIIELLNSIDTSCFLMYILMGALVAIMVSK